MVRQARTIHSRPQGARRRRIAAVAATAVALLLAGCSVSGTGDSALGPGIAPPESLEPFVFDQPAGEVPDLPKRIGWAYPSDAEFFLQITDALETAADERDLEVITAMANDDSAKNIEQMETFLQRGVGSLTLQPLDVNAQAAVMQRAINEGVAVMSLVTPPSTSQVIADQYAVGRTQGEAAAKYIVDELDSKAKVVYFNQDSNEAVQPRHQGVLDALKEVGDGVEIVADVEPQALSQDGGFETMNTIIQKDPNVDVVLGGDMHVLGALSALEAAGAVKPDMYLAGIDGDDQALERVKEGGVYRASFAFAYPLMGYAWGQFTGDWLEGKPIPQVIELSAIELNSADKITKFESDMDDVKSTWQSADEYMRFYGSISYETRDQYINEGV